MPGPARTGNILIIDGHGSTDNNNFDFRRGAAVRCNLYSYVFEGIPILVTMSERVIVDGFAGRINQGHSDVRSSRIGGSGIRDRILYAQDLDAHGRPQWNYQVPSSWGADVIDLVAREGGTAPMVTWYNAATARESSRVLTYIQAGDDHTVRLSTIINYFNARPYDILWVVCRVA